MLEFSTAQRVNAPTSAFSRVNCTSFGYIKIATKIIWNTAPHSVSLRLGQQRFTEKRDSNKPDLVGLPHFTFQASGGIFITLCLARCTWTEKNVGIKTSWSFMINHHIDRCEEFYQRHPGRWFEQEKLRPERSEACPLEPRPMSPGPRPGALCWTLYCYQGRSSDFPRRHAVP